MQSGYVTCECKSFLRFIIFLKKSNQRRKAVSSSYCHGHLPPKVVGGAGIGGNRRGGRARCSSSGRLHATQPEERLIHCGEGTTAWKKGEAIELLREQGGRRMSMRSIANGALIRMLPGKLQPNIFQVTC